MWNGVLQTGADPPAEGADQRTSEEQCSWGAAEANKHSQMEAAGGQGFVIQIFHVFFLEMLILRDVILSSREGILVNTCSSRRFNACRRDWSPKPRSWRSRSFCCRFTPPPSLGNLGLWWQTLLENWKEFQSLRHISLNWNYFAIEKPEFYFLARQKNKLSWNKGLLVS